MSLTSWLISSPPVILDLPHSPDLYSSSSSNHPPRSRNSKYCRKISIHRTTTLLPLHPASFARNAHRNHSGSPNHCRSGCGGDTSDSGFLPLPRVRFVIMGDYCTDLVVCLQPAACSRFTALSRFDEPTRYPPLIIAGHFLHSQHFQYHLDRSLYSWTVSHPSFPASFTRNDRRNHPASPDHLQSTRMG